MEISTIADVKLVGRSIAEDWPVDSSLRESVVSKLLDIVVGPDEKLAVAASRVLLAADALNIKKRIELEKIAQAEQERKRQLIEYAVKLGLVNNVIDGTGRMDSESSEG